MKNKIFRYVLLTMFSTVLAVCSAYFVKGKNDFVHADGLPSYFTTYISNDAKNEDKTSYSEQYPNKLCDVLNGDSYLLATGEVVVISLNKNNDPSSNIIIDQVASYEIIINGNKVAPSDADNAMEIYQPDGVFELLIKYGAKTIFGEYQINITYWEKSGAISTYKQLQTNFVLLNKSDYLINDTTNNTNLNKSYTTNNGIYARTVYFNYTSKVLQSGSILPTLTYNKERFSIILTKNVSGGLSFTQTIGYDGTTVTTSGDMVLQKEDIVELAGQKSVKLVFNDVGSYVIEYRYLFTNNGRVKNLTFANYFAKADKIDVFGYQVNYSDFSTGKYAEMKVRNQENIDTQYATDFSYSINEASIDASKDGVVWASIKDYVQKTNQPLINFITSKSKLDEEKSRIYKVTNDNIGDGETFDNTPIGDTGEYFIKIVYTYDDFGGSDLGIIYDGTRYFVQYFAFEITEDMPDFSVEAINTDESGASILANDSFTNKDVLIKKETEYKSVYYAPTKIVVFKQTNYSGSFEQIADDIPADGLKVTESARYKVSLYFGRNNEKGFTTYFTVDKNEIQGTTTNTLLPISDKTYIKDGYVDFFTNQAVAISWQNKPSGAKVYASYKLVPMTKTYKTYSSSILAQFYNNEKSVPTPYAFACPETLAEIDCFNTQDFTYISSERILSSEGLYIVRIYDDAGNEKKFAFVIDRSPAQALIYYNDEYSMSNEANIMSDDFEVAIGKYKVIEMNGFNNLQKDKWFKELYQDKKYSSYFKQYYTPSGNFVRVQVDDRVVYTQDNLANIAETKESDYKINIQFIQIDGGYGKALEHQYTFYILDESSTKQLKGYDRYSLENASENYSGLKEIETSSDASRITINYTDNNDLSHKLTQIKTSETENTKTIYYSPLSTSSIKTTDKSLILSFNAQPAKGEIEISKVSYRFAPFENATNQNGDKLPTLTFGEMSESIVIYDKYDSSALKASVSTESGLYEWFVNQFYNSRTGALETRPGKYEIIREYDSSLSGSSAKVSEKLDFLVRKLVFIVDNNEIVSNPEKYVDELGNPVLISTVGSANRIQVGNKFFDSLYIAKNIEGNTSILTTNMLPVMVKVPAFKYGYINSRGEFVGDKENINYYDDMPIYRLSAKIHYSTNPDLLDSNPQEVYKSEINTDGKWLTFGDNNQLKKEGYYKVFISQDNNTFSYVFNITYDKPSFNVAKTNNAEIFNNSGIYYTNEKVVKISWTDNASEFMAKINQNEIYYSINNGTKTKIAPEIITKNGLNNSFELDITQIGAYNNGAKIDIFMQYEGNANDYPETYFMSTKTIIIDTMAPTDNLNRLIGATGISADELREVDDTYNITTTSGIYQNFSFALDISQLKDAILANTGSLTDTYAIYYNDITNKTTGYKYVETNINTLKTSLPNRYNYQLIANKLEDLVGKYYEFVEADRAGNLTVYSIYFYNSSTRQDNTAITYSYNKNNNETENLFIKDIKNNVYLYSKNAFDIKNIDFFGYKYLDIYIEGQRYIRTPYTNGLFIKYSQGTDEFYGLQNISTLPSSNNIYEIELVNVPSFGNIKLNVSVTNKNLEVISLNSTGQYYNQEGILIKIPSSNSEKDLKIFAKSLIIKSMPSDINLLDTTKILGFENRFTSSSSDDLSTDLVYINYVTYLGERYIRFAIKNPIENINYTYEIKDNFGEQTNIIHIYGETVIDDVMTSKVDIIEKYSDKGFYTYYSTENIIYKFNTAKYMAKLSINIGGTSLGHVTFDNQTTNVKGDYYSASVDAKTKICTVTLKKAPLNLANGQYGDCVDFKLELISCIDMNISETLYFEIYNIVPIINLWGTKGESQNDLFNKGRMYSSEILITYSAINSSKYGTVVALSMDNENLATIKTSHKVSQKGTYYIYVCYDEMFTDSQYNQIFEFTITDREEDYYTVVVHTDDGDIVKNPTGQVFKTTKEDKIYVVNTHYFVNSPNYQIITNTYLNITCLEDETFTSDGFTTKTYLISNAKSETPVSKYYTKTIAITIIPESTKILTKFAHNISGGKSESLLGDNSATFVAEKGEKNKTIVWQPYFGVPENKVSVKVYYETIDEKSIYDAKITIDSEGYASMELGTSGTYYLQFSDLAGNIHYFDEYDTNEYFTITYLKSVIFKVQGETPINYATYNEDVIISIDAYTLKYYNSYAKPTISVLRNGEEYKPQRDSTGLQYTFTESGLYKVWFSAELTEKGESTPKTINEEPIYFNIIRANESNSEYSITKYADYLIEKIEKGVVINAEYVYQDVTDVYTNKNMGEIVTYTELDANGATITKSYLKNLTLSNDDYFTGPGRYRIYIRTNNEFNQTFSYEIYINKQVSPINISIDNLGETTKDITIKFNAKNMIEAMGDCVLKITGMQDLILTKELLDADRLQSTYEIILSDNQTYTIEIRTIGGNLLESYKVTKNAPLNTITIILIVVSAVVVTAFVIIFILLRKKMKIR